ncbi:hypothetical protein DF3PA_100112 [Candidatus Defluviicoccus seviourii]|uniref:Uncharacterized protein n=1 Tax=Candidatus Defluviicoccus seviourii TaxID=2565273 RepID=A0A564W9Y0_9PROT|nr:hypothetical protein DF3PA_100112 [Candidatus Defluviicoccus seviourii]
MRYDIPYLVRGLHNGFILGLRGMNVDIEPLRKKLY